MGQWEKNAVRGVFPPMCMPLTEDFQVAVPSLRSMVDYFLEGEAQG